MKSLWPEGPTQSRARKTQKGSGMPLRDEMRTELLKLARAGTPSIIASLLSADFTARQVAAWFGSNNSALSGARPVDLILTEPESVRFAAAREANPPEF